MDLTNTSLLEQFKSQLGWSIDYVTWWTYVKKGYVKPSSYMQDGKRVVPIYYQRDFGLIVATLKHLVELGKIRIKGYDQVKKDKRQNDPQT